MDKKLDNLSSSLIFDAHKRLGLSVRVLSYTLNPIIFSEDLQNHFQLLVQRALCTKIMWFIEQ